MKKFIFTVFMSLLLIVGSYSQNSDSKNLPDFFKFLYEEPDYIYGNVKEIQCSSFDAIERDGKIVKIGMLITNSYINQICSFYLNPEGQVAQMTAKNMAGDWIGVFSYEKNKLGNIIWLNDNLIKYKWDYSYSDNGKMERIISDVLTNKTVGTLSCDLDKNGLIMKQVDFNNLENKEGNTITYQRKNDGTIIDKITITPDGKAFAHMDGWEYNEKGNKHKVHRIVERGEKVDRYGSVRTYEYDDKGNWIKRTSVNPITNNITITEREFVYN